jgi:xylan 1,4-beta-xylosidase
MQPCGAVCKARIHNEYMRLLIFLAVVSALNAQKAVTIRVDAATRIGPFKPVFGYFGYDEPNYTYTKNGARLVGELAALSAAPIYIRTHFMLTTGDGTPGLKWGSTNAYTEDSSGKPVYDWTIADRIFDTWVHAGAKPFVEIGFMPRALSSKPEPYQPVWIPGARNEQYSIGWTYPPKDYEKWGELVYQWVRHAVEKYGRAEAASWYWEVWNEPDISYWHGTPEEYDKLYDYAAKAVKRALPEARVGGPASTGPASERAGQFLRQFLQHCSDTGAPLDFISYHAKGQPKVVDGRVRMGIAKNIEDVEKGYAIVASFPKFRNLPIVLTESDPEGCAACSARVYPQNAYRNGPLYAAYEAAMMKNVLDLAGSARVNIQGMLTWAFEFEDQPWFDGFRTLATNGVDKPILNLFRMAGMMRGDRVNVESTAGIQPDRLMAEGVRGDRYVDGLAVRSDREISLLAWNYHDDDAPSVDARVRAVLAGLANAPHRTLLRHYRIDQIHSNSWTAWKQMGSPQQPSADQVSALEAAGQLQLLESPRWIDVHDGAVSVEFDLPGQGVSLLQLSW